tara:strand:- start:476 stop:937 length:462 start_codon:yes stop_codon:yes gene_type:complete
VPVKRTRTKSAGKPGKARRASIPGGRPKKKSNGFNKSAAFWGRLAKQEPNNAEMTLFGIMFYLGLPYKYTGNGQFILMGHAPDFVHLKNRKIVEFYGERWHKPPEEQERIDLFARADYQVLVVWQREIKPNPVSRKKLYKRLLDFEALPDLER